MCLNNVRSFLHNKNFSFKSHKVNWLVAIKCPGHFTSMDPILIPSTEANISSTEKGVYSGHATLENLAREVLLW